MKLLSVADMALMTAKSRNTITRRLANLMPVEEHTARGSIYAASVALPIIYRPDFVTPSSLQANGNVLDLQAERARLAHFQANKYVLEAENLKGNLIEADLVEEVWTAQLANLRAKLLTIPSRAAPQAAILDDEHQMVKFLQKLIYDALSELSEYTPDQYRRKGSKTGTRSLGTATDVDGKPMGGQAPETKRRVKRGAGAVGHVKG